MQFTIEFWIALCPQLVITVKLSTVHHLKTNDQTEKAIIKLKPYLQNHINYQQNNWVK